MLGATLKVLAWLAADANTGIMFVLSGFAFCYKNLFWLAFSHRHHLKLAHTGKLFVATLFEVEISEKSWILFSLHCICVFSAPMCFTGKDFQWKLSCHSWFATTALPQRKVCVKLLSVEEEGVGKLNASCAALRVVQKELWWSLKVPFFTFNRPWAQPPDFPKKICIKDPFRIDMARCKSENDQMCLLCIM